MDVSRSVANNVSVVLSISNKISSNIGNTVFVPITPLMICNLFNNSEPILGAEVFMRYNLNGFSLQSRASQIISYSLPASGYVQLKEYDLQNNLISTLVDEVSDAGSHNIVRNFSQEQYEQIAPLGVGITKLVLEFGDETIIDYPILLTGFDWYGSLLP